MRQNLQRRLLIFVPRVCVFRGSCFQFLSSLICLVTNLVRLSGISSVREKYTVVLRRWESETKIVGFINSFDKTKNFNKDLR